MRMLWKSIRDPHPNPLPHPDGCPGERGQTWDAVSRSIERLLDEAEWPDVAAAFAHQARGLAGEIDHRGHLAVAGARIDHQVDVVLEVAADLLRVVQRHAVGGEDQRGREQRLAQ